MAFNSINFKKSLLSWQAASKKAPGDINKATEEFADHPDAVTRLHELSHHIADSTSRLNHLLDDIVNAKDDNKRTTAAKKALENAHQYQSYVNSTQAPPGTLNGLKAGLNELVKGLAV